MTLKVIGESFATDFFWINMKNSIIKYKLFICLYKGNDE